MKKRGLGLGLTILGLVLVNLVMTWFSIPLGAMDIIVCPVALGLMVWGAIALYRGRKKSTPPKIEPLSFSKRIRFIAVFLLMAAMGAVLMLSGIREPFKLFTGVKGAAHGYTVVCLGALILGFSCFGLYRLTLGYPKDLNR